MNSTLLAPALVAALVLLPSCSSSRGSDRGEEVSLLRTGRVNVTAQRSLGGQTWILRDLVAEGGGKDSLLGLHVQAFVDLDGDGVPGDGEMRGGWHVTSAVGTTVLAAAGMLTTASFQGESPELWKLEVFVIYGTSSGQTSEDRSVVPIAF